MLKIESNLSSAKKEIKKEFAHARNLSSLKNHSASQVGFGGIKEGIIQGASNVASNSTVHVLVSTIGCMIARPTIIMLDKETPKDEKIYAGAWQVGIAAFAIPIFTVWDKYFAKFGQFLSQKMLGVDIAQKAEGLLQNKTQAKDLLFKHSEKLVLGPDALENAFHSDDPAMQKVKDAIKKIHDEKLSNGLFGKRKLREGH